MSGGFLRLCTHSHSLIHAHTLVTEQALANTRTDIPLILLGQSCRAAKHKYTNIISWSTVASSILTLLSKTSLRWCLIALYINRAGASDFHFIISVLISLSIILPINHFLTFSHIWKDETSECLVFLPTSTSNQLSKLVLVLMID